MEIGPSPQGMATIEEKEQKNIMHITLSIAPFPLFILCRTGLVVTRLIPKKEIN